MTFKDDRTEHEKLTHNHIVRMHDTYMSGWGGAEGGISYAGWACRYRDINKVEAWVKSRDDSKRVQVVKGNWKPRGKGHCHIYVVNDGHPSLGGL